MKVSISLDSEVDGTLSAEVALRAHELLECITEIRNQIRSWCKYDATGDGAIKAMDDIADTIDNLEIGRLTE